MRIDELSPGARLDWCHLMDRGYCLIRDAAPAKKVEALDRDLAPAFETAPMCNGKFSGKRTQRFGRLLLRSAKAERYVLHDAITAISEYVLALGCDNMQLSLTQGIAVHPGEVDQLPHRADHVWMAGSERHELLVNVIWPLTRHTAETGSVLVWPGTHSRGITFPPPKGPGLAIEMGPGDALMVLGSTLHGSSANRSETVRRSVKVGYCLGWLKPEENQWLAYPPAIARRFSAELAALVGYQRHPPNLGWYEGLCPSLLLDQLPKELPGPTDILPSWEMRELEAFTANRESRP